MPENARLGKRIAIIGGPGAGKTWLAERLGELTGAPAHELDAIFWGPGWTPRPDDVARRDIARIVAQETWIVDGTYRRFWPIVWPRAQSLVWLDYSGYVLEWRLLCRTIPRILTRQELWHGNVETWRGQFADRDSLLWDAWSARSRLRERVTKGLAEPQYQHLTLIRHLSPRETRHWLANMADLADQS